MSSQSFDKDAFEAQVKVWMDAPFDAATRDEVGKLFEKYSELYDRFYTQMEFGTGGLRGLMGAGTNRMNQYTVSQATQGLANYIRQQVKNPKKRRFVVGYDSRNNSRFFAETAAAVCAANGIEVYLFKQIRPTPMMSYAIRYFEATSGVMITASHNPKEYNGYKAYWNDGKQITPPHDKRIIAEVRKVDTMDKVKTTDFKRALASGKIKLVGSDIDRAYLAEVKKQRVNVDVIKEWGAKTKIVFTPLHGVGGTVIPKALKQWGFKNVIEEPRQKIPDGNFPTAASPNPEESAALDEAIKLAKKRDAYMVLATDPDADRLGIAVRIKKGQYGLITGNELGALMTWYLLEQHSKAGTLPENPLVVSTIVTSDLVEYIAPAYGATVIETHTGFKWIADEINKNVALRAQGRKHLNFLFGFEESYGYLMGEYARDKDAVVASCIVSEIACWAQSQNMSLFQLLEKIKMGFGIFQEQQKAIYHHGATGMSKIKSIMDKLRKNPPKKVGSLKVERIADYLTNEVKDLKTGRKSKGPGLPASNVLEFALAGGSKIFARPSGTEPKIKFYMNFCDRKNLPIKNKTELGKKSKALDKQLQSCLAAFLKYVG